MPAKPKAPSTVDQAEVAQFSRLGRAMVGSRAARWRRCTSSTRCGSAISATRRRRISAATASGSIASRACASSISAAAAASCPSRWRGSARAVVGADPAAANIAAARQHAAQSDLTIDYRATTAEALADAGERFDVVLAMEVVEHVADVRAVRAPLRGDGEAGRLMIAATLNRTLKSFRARDRRRGICPALAAARHASLGQVRHAERAGSGDAAAGLRLLDERGVIYNLFADRWQLSDDMDVNYMVTAERPGSDANFKSLLRHRPACAGPSTFSISVIDADGGQARP